MIQIYNPDNTDYEKNGDMTLFPTSAKIHMILNGSWTAQIDHPIDPEGRYKYIQDQAVVKIPSFNGEQLFRIKSKTKTEAFFTLGFETSSLFLINNRTNSDIIINLSFQN